MIPPLLYIATRSLSTLAPLPQSMCSHTHVVPSKLGSNDSFGSRHKDRNDLCKVDVPGDAWFPQARGPSTRMLQKEGICHASTIAAFTSSCQVNIGLLPLGPPRHHCLQPPHSEENRHCFYLLRLALGSILATLFLALPVLFAWHCVFHAPALFRPPGNSCLAGGWHLRIKPRVAIVFVYFSCGISATRSRDLVVCMPRCFLLCMLTSRCGA